MLGEAATCGTCGNEIRFVEYRGQKKWWHRDPDVDHFPVLGTPLPPGDWDRMMAQIAERVEERKKKGKKKAEEGDEDTTEIIENVVVQPRVEIPEIKEPHVPRGVMLIAKPAMVAGWNLTAWRSRGGVRHRTGGHYVREAEFIELKGVDPNSTRRFVALWEVDKGFDFAYLAVLSRSTETYSTMKIGSPGLKAWIKGGDAEADFLEANPTYQHYFQEAR